MEQASGTSTSSNTKVDVPGASPIDTHKIEGKHRNWALTVFDFKEIGALKSENKFSYLIYGKEICPKTQKTHWQTFVYFKNPRTFNGIKKILKTTHIEVCYSQNSDNIAYCKKDGDFIEIGEPPGDNGVKNIKKIINEMSLTELMTNDPETFVKYRNGIKELYNLKNKNKKSKKKIEFIWIYGPTGTGKSERIFDKHLEDSTTTIDFTNGFFNDWGDDKILIIEEFRGNIPYNILLKLTDQYRNWNNVNIKGGTKLVDIDKLYITSCLRPEQCYPNLAAEDKIDQLLRRITEVIYTGEAIVKGKELAMPEGFEPMNR